MLVCAVVSYPLTPCPVCEGTVDSTSHTMFAISSRMKFTRSIGALSSTLPTAGGR
jgi:hypothetical protein